MSGHPEDGGPQILQAQELSYGDYLKIPELLNLQVLLSEPAHHDETLFIIIHQTFELWFKQILLELDSAIQAMQADRVLRATKYIKRVVVIMQVLVKQIHVLETMATAEFLQFRDRLNPASGFQSIQFREIEFVSGLKNLRYLDSFKNRPEFQETLLRRFEGPDLRTSFYELLRRAGYSLPETLPGALEEESEETRLAIIQALVKLYQRPDDDLRNYLLAETLVDFDEHLVLWRTHHVIMVERVIGHRRGTGGSAGVAYLQSTVGKRCFPHLWEVRTYLEKVPQH